MTGVDTPDPLVVVLSGHPDDAELAALTVAIMALAAQPAAPALPLPATWLRAPVHVAPASWAA